MVHVRRLVKAGQTSHTVSLPKEWLDKNDLKKGDTLYLYEKSTKELLISPHIKKSNQSKREITISFDKNKSIDTLQRELTSAYINNYHIINIMGEQIGAYQKELRNMLRDFVALELVDQSSKIITAKDFLNTEDISIEKTIRRIDMILRSMFNDMFSNKSQETLSFRDQDVNRLYFLLFRMIKGCLQDDSLAEQFRIKPVQILSLWFLSVNLENIADCCTYIHPLLKKTDDKKSLNFIQKISDNYTNLMNSFYKKDKHSADVFARQRIKLMEEINELPVETHEQYKHLINLLNNISRIIIDDE